GVETADIAETYEEEKTVADSADTTDPDEGGEAFYVAEFSAGVSRRALPIPLGISTSGYGQSKKKGDPVSPFADAFPATVRIHSLPMIKCLTLAKGDDIAVLVTFGLSGMTDPIFRRSAALVKEKTGIDVEKRMIISANHTHSSAGRFVDHMLAATVADSYFPQLFVNMTDAIAECITGSIQDLSPVKIGFARTENPDVHFDRRCSNPPLKDSTINVVRVDDAASGKTKGLLVTFAAHGTVFKAGQRMISGDAPGVIEHKIEESFDYPLTALYFQGWAGDMGPSEPEYQPLPAATGALEPEINFAEAMGNSFAGSVLGVFPGMEMKDDVELESVSRIAPITRELIGYGEGEFEYPYGAVFCGNDQPEACWDSGDPLPDVTSCFDFVFEELSMNYIRLTLIRAGGHVFASMGGEPVTQFGLDYSKAISDETGYETIFIGYANDHIGYILPEDDYLHGGYEPSMSYWGWKFADYLLKLGHEMGKLLKNPEYQFPIEEKDKLKTINTNSSNPYNSAKSLSNPAITAQPKKKCSSMEIASVEWAGGDPWLGTPYVKLQIKENGVFKDFMRKNNTPLDNLAYEFILDMKPVPSYEEVKKAAERNFFWKASLPLSRTLTTTTPEIKGTFRFYASGRILIGTEVVNYEIFSDEFEVTDTL
ncbi:MAG: neutral/alkaline non-lysosomal ceramidase N-terminal domain-containing protein, partial [Deltaproteobacteria bacterium]|nr:neutral/alkaline non-lysosomal ceramidase N-terminal domain-containing protein [Deltaproteobacteria bacterium]